MNFLEKNKKELEKKFNVYYGYKLNFDQIKKIINKFDAWICHPSPKFIIKNDFTKKTVKKSIKFILNKLIR